MQMYLPSATAAALDRGKNNLVERTVHLLFQGVKTSIVLNLYLPSQPPKTQILELQTIAANAQRGVFSPLTCFHSQLKISQAQHPAIPLFLPSQPLMTYTFPFKYTQECYFLANAIGFFFSSPFCYLGEYKQQLFEDPPPVIKIYPVGSVQAEAQYCISALLIVVRLQQLVKGQSVSIFFLSPKKHILGVTLWQIWMKLQFPVKGITRTGNSTTVGFLWRLILVSYMTISSQTFLSFYIFQSSWTVLALSLELLQRSAVSYFSCSVSSLSSFYKNLVSQSLLRWCQSTSRFFMILNMRSNSSVLSLQLLSNSCLTQLQLDQFFSRTSRSLSNLAISIDSFFFAMKKF